MDYSEIREEVVETLKDVGKKISLSRDSSEYSPTQEKPESSKTISGHGVLLPYSTFEINETTVLSGDKKMLFVGDEPKVGDIYNGWRVQSVEGFDPVDDGVILYTCNMRK